MGEKALQETWNRTERENCNEIWHLHFKSSQVFPVRASSVLTLSFQSPQCQWGRVFQREVFSRGVRPAPAAPANISRCAPTGGWRCRALLLPSGPARPRTRRTPQLCLQGYAEGPWLWFCPAPVLCICSFPALQPRDTGLRPISLLPGRPGESCFADSSSPQELLLWLPRRDPKAANYSASLPVPFNPRNTSKN